MPPEPSTIQPGESVLVHFDGEGNDPVGVGVLAVLTGGEKPGWKS
jgi:hypothetical protein